MEIITRFAPSPTGFLHIGGARTALFNYLFAQRFGGKYLLRIEDTDRERSTQTAINAILDGLGWLNLLGDSEVTFQSQGIERHKEVAKALIDQGHAYYCYCSQKELQEMRSEALKQGKKTLYDGRWRNRPKSEAPSNIKPVLRLKTTQQGQTTIEDLVQGTVSVDNELIDDFILLRADGSPTYMHSVVIDDHDMGVTHIIRGDDHLNNAFRQIQLFKAMNWKIPIFAHIPLIHGEDGSKLSKRHGALGVDTYRDLGYLPDAVCNYLLRLGWSHGNDEVISRKQAVEWFDFDKVGQSASRFDFQKLNNINGIYIRNFDEQALVKLVLDELKTRPNLEFNTKTQRRISSGISGLKQRAKTLKELADGAEFFVAQVPLSMNEKALEILTDEAKKLLKGLLNPLEKLRDWTEPTIENTVKVYADECGIKLGEIALPLRAALTGSNTSPSVFEVTTILGWDEVNLRIKSVC